MTVSCYLHSALADDDSTLPKYNHNSYLRSIGLFL